MKVNTIDEVIDQLDTIISRCKEDQNVLGYFAALYRKVTVVIKERIEEGHFDDNSRMEKLDVIFANRYLEAYAQYESGNLPMSSWIKSFEISEKYWPIVLQHLLLGMNAHINLDLGIAASQISTPETIQGLKNDFDRINEILSSLVSEVQRDLSEIWPLLLYVLKLTRKVDDFLIDFSMKVARKGAWKFAMKLVEKTGTSRDDFIKERDQKVANLSYIISKPGFIVSIIYGIIRLTERGSVADKIVALEI